MMRELEKLFETLKDEFNQRMSNAGYFTNSNDSIESHVAYAGGSITDSYEDISMDEDEIQDNSSSVADSNLKSNKLGSIDSEPESSSHMDDNNLIEDKISSRRLSEKESDGQINSTMASIENENLNSENPPEKKLDEPVAIIPDYKDINTNFLSSETDEKVENQPIDLIMNDEEIKDVIIDETAHLIVEDQQNILSMESEQTDENIDITNDNMLNDTSQCSRQIKDEMEEMKQIDSSEQIKAIENDELTEIIPKEIVTSENKFNQCNNSEVKEDLLNLNSTNTTDIQVNEKIIEFNDRDSIEKFIEINDNNKSIENINEINGSKANEIFIEIIKNKAIEKIIQIKDNNNKSIENICNKESPEDNFVEIKILENITKPSRVKSHQMKLTDKEKSRKISNDRTSMRKSVRHISTSRKMWSEMPEVIDSGILADFPKKELQLQEAMFEIITSEDSYYQSLIVLTSHFFDSELFNISDDKEGLVSQIDKHHIFSNVIYIVKASHSFMIDLEQRWHDQKPVLFDICDIVLNHAVSDDFQHYVTYLRNQQYQTKALKRLLENESFKQQLAKLESSPKCGKLALDSFLMLPMQRLTRLKLLVEAISKLHNCEELTDKIKSSTKMVARNALEELKKLLNTSNTEKGLMDQKGALLSLINKIDFPHNMKRITFSDRILLREEEFRVHQHTQIKTIRKFSKKKQPLLTLLVFNDLLIITKKKGPRLLVIDYCIKDYVEAKSFVSAQDISSNDASSNTSAIDINNEPPSPMRSLAPTLLRSKTSITADEKKRLSVPLNNSFISMPSINKIDDQETKTQTFSLTLTRSHSSLFTNPIYLTARNKEERDLWLTIFNKDHFQSNPSLSNRSNPSKLQKSLSLKINSNYTEKSYTKKNHFLKKSNE